MEFTCYHASWSGPFKGVFRLPPTCTRVTNIPRLSPDSPIPKLYLVLKRSGDPGKLTLPPMEINSQFLVTDPE